MRDIWTAKHPLHPEKKFTLHMLTGQPEAWKS